MKVLYLHQHFSTPNGSIGIRSYWMSQHLISRGHKVTIVCGSYSGADTGLVNNFVNGERRGHVDGIEIIELNLAYSNSDLFLKRFLIFIKYALKSLKIIFQERYDIIFATSTPLTAGIPGIFARWMKNKPFVFEVRDLWPELPKEMGVITNPITLFSMSLLEKATYHSAHHLIALAPGISEGIIKKGINKELVSLIPNGCDLNIFNNIADKWRPSNIDKTDFLALYAGTHGEANGLNNLLDVAKELKNRKRDDIKFLLIGQGKLKDSLKEIAINSELDNVIFHDLIDKKKLASLMSSTDIGLQILADCKAFYNGTSPNKFFDYLSAGLPVLNNYPGWLSNMINEYECGYAVPPNDPIAFADALEDAANNPSKLTLMGMNSSSLALKEFNRIDLAQKWVDILENVYLNRVKK